LRIRASGDLPSSDFRRRTLPPPLTAGVGGILIIAGLLTRVIAIPFIIEMLVAMASTKIPIYLGTSPLPLPPVPPQIGFWAVLHEIRSEYAQLASCAFLLLAGPGRLSLDALLSKQRSEVTGFKRSDNSEARLINAA
jgi:hypothetical protein